MDAIDILGGILKGGMPGSGGGGSKGGGGGNILRDILGGGGGRPRPTQQKGSSPPSANEIDRQAKQLEDLLNVATGNDSGGGGAAAPRRAPSRPVDWGNSGTTRKTIPTPVPSSQRDTISLDDEPDRLNEEALVLIRAMISAAKSDGRVSRDEQKEILNRIGDAPREVVDFLQKEFDRPVDVRDFAWSVPIGMEQKVYGISLAAIDLDASSEARYLHELAHALRIPPSTRDDIHRRFNEPVIKG